MSAKEILEGRHVAIYFADTKTEEELDRERQKIQETNSNAPDFTRSSYFIQQVNTTNETANGSPPLGGHLLVTG